MRLPSRLANLPVFAFSVAFPLFLTACDGKVNQCNKLIETVNAHTQGVSDGLGKAVQDGDAGQVQTAVRNAAQAVGALELKDAKIIEFAETYKALLDEADKVGQQAAAATTAKDASAAEGLQQAFNTIVEKELKLVGEINGYCQAS